MKVESYQSWRKVRQARASPSSALRFCLIYDNILEASELVIIS